MNQDIKQRQENQAEEDEREDIVLNLTLAGARECLLDLLEQMDSLKGFSVINGSFFVNPSDSSFQ